MKVLLIDDEDDIRKVAEFALRKVGGFNTFVASSARNGIALAKQILPDVILLDVMMPVMDGLQAFLELRQNPATASIPVIFMTAKVQRVEVEHYLTVGAIGVIAKPFDPVQLPKEVERLMARRSVRI